MTEEKGTSERGSLAESPPVRVLRLGLEVSVAAIVSLYAIIITIQVFYRYVLNSSLVWSEELVRYGLLWGVMLGAALASDRHAHVALDPLRGLIPERLQKVVDWIAGLGIIGFSAAMVWYGSIYCFRVRMMMSPAIQLPMVYVYAAIPTGGALIAFFTLVHLAAGTRQDSVEAEV